ESRDRRMGEALPDLGSRRRAERTITRSHWAAAWGRRARLLRVFHQRCQGARARRRPGADRTIGGADVEQDAKEAMQGLVADQYKPCHERRNPPLPSIERFWRIFPGCPETLVS